MSAEVLASNRPARGAAAEPVHRPRARRRSGQHISFHLQLPMLSNHQGRLYQVAARWLALSTRVGALIRNAFAAPQQAPVPGRRAPDAPVIAGGLAIAGLVLGLVLAPRATQAAPAARPASAPAMAEVHALVQQRCAMCHNAAVATRGVALHTPELIRRHATAIHRQAVLQRTMPPNNATQMTEGERELLEGWLASPDRRR